MQYDNKSKSNRIQIFASEIGLKSLSESKRWQSDGTFFCAPKPFKQIYYIMCAKPGEKMLPCAYICMTNRTYKSYLEVFEQLKLCGLKYGFELSPTLALTDFERAAGKGLRFSFPGITLKGCFFHFKQAIGRWIFSHGYKMTYAINMDFKNWFRKLSSLAVVPIEKLQDAWDLIKLESKEINVNVEPIIKYFEKTWMTGDFQPADWNQYGEFDQRTNNVVEHYNADVNRTLKTKPNLLKFYDFLRGEENKMEINLIQSDKEPFYVKKATKDVSVP